MNKPLKTLIAVVFALGVAGAGIFFWFNSFMKNLEEDRALTIQLSPVLLKQLGGKEISDFPSHPAPIQWDGKFLQVDYGTIPGGAGANPPLNFVYNKKRNQQLNTDRFYPGNDIKGIVWLTLDSKVVGHYSGGYQALQRYYVLSYLDLAQGAILAQDTIWGGMPPQSISGADNAGLGSLPKEEDVIKAIQSRTH